MPDETIKLDMNVNLTIEMEKAEWDRLLADAREDDERNPQDPPEVYAAMNIASDFEGEEINVTIYDAKLKAVWIASADPPTVI